MVFAEAARRWAPRPAGSVAFGAVKRRPLLVLCPDIHAPRGHRQVHLRDGPWSLEPQQVTIQLRVAHPATLPRRSLLASAEPRRSRKNQFYGYTTSPNSTRHETAVSAVVPPPVAKVITIPAPEAVNVIAKVDVAAAPTEFKTVLCPSITAVPPSHRTASTYSRRRVTRLPPMTAPQIAVTRSS